jgi:hypothetical protein
MKHIGFKHQRENKQSRIKSPSNRNPTKGVILMVIRSSMRVATLLTILTTSLFLSLSQTRTLITLNVVHIIMIRIQIFLQSHRLLGTKLLSHGFGKINKVAIISLVSHLAVIIADTIFRHRYASNTI